jgi:hypothetical protein
MSEARLNLTKERQNGGRFNRRPRLTAHSTGVESACLLSLPWMLFADISRSVNSGVRLLSIYGSSK